jgi:hypothetical protein
VHWEDEATERWEQGPEHVSAEEAVAWARRYADVVQVFVGEEEVPYSAGVRQPEGETLPPWPAGGLEIRARPVGTPRDGSVQIVDWVLRSEARMPHPGNAALERMHAYIERAARVSRVVSVEPREDGVAVVYAIPAAHEGHAVMLGHQLVREAARHALPASETDAPIVVETTSWQPD